MDNNASGKKLFKVHKSLEWATNRVDVSLQMEFFINSVDSWKLQYTHFIHIPNKSTWPIWIMQSLPER